MAQSFGSRRQQARAALPPFTLPPPDFPRAADQSPSGLGASGVPAAGSPYSTGTASSPGYSTSALASPYPAQRPYSSTSSAYPHRLQPSEDGPGRDPQHHSGPLSHPHQPTTSARKPLPESPSQQLTSPPRFTEKLPPISSLIPTYSPRSPNPSTPSPCPGPGPGHLARPPGMLSPPALYQLPGPQLRHGLPPHHGPLRTLAPPLIIPTLAPGSRPPPGSGSGHGYGQGAYHEFSVGPYAVVRESSQQDRPFKCDLCTQCFSRNHDLKRHKRIHMAAKPFPCPTCNKSFSRRDALKRHRLVKACYKKGAEGQKVRYESSPDSEQEFAGDWKGTEGAAKNAQDGTSRERAADERVQSEALPPVERLPS